jgi:superfamily II DNA or RNA helicase
MKLRPFQESAIQQCRDALSSGNKRIVFYAPTGAGKSVIAESLTKLSLGRGKRVAIIANRVQLVKQMADRFAASGISYGILQGGNTNNIHLPVVICSINTVDKRGLPDCDVIIIDEGHACAGSKMYRDLIFQRNNVPVIALTATPFSKGMAKPYKELENEPLFQHMVIAETIKGLISLGFLVDCEIYAPSEPDLSGVKMVKNAFGEKDYSDMSKELAEAVDQPSLVGDIVQHWHKLAEGKPTICFATSITHSKHIVEQFRATGVTAEHIDCYMHEDDKERITREFKAGKFTVLSNVALLAEGFDYPACEVMILARPTRSLIRYIQMVGRILRPFHGKDRGLLLDHSGSVRHLGFPTDDLPLELDDGSVTSKTKKEIEEPKPKKCAKCHYLKPPKMAKCPKCGFEAVRTAEEIDIEAGELVKLEKKPKQDKKSKQATYSECLGMASMRGKDVHWADGLYKHITGVWPRSLLVIEAIPSNETIGKEKQRRIAYAKRMESNKSPALERLAALKSLVGGNHAAG